MKRIIVLAIIACTICACYNTNASNVKISGFINNPKGNKVTLQVQSLGKLFTFAIDSKGFFKGEIDVKEGLYARLVNNKVAVPLYLEPGVNIELSYDRSEVKKGKYSSVKIAGKGNIETKMMLDFYEKQLSHSSQELFVLTPIEFQKIQRNTAEYNVKIIDDFVKANGDINKGFVQLFKYQVQISLAASFFYYPSYHSMMNKQDKSAIPKNFNFFIEKLPKNNIDVYTKVYRYNTYEVSVWNQLLMEKVMPLQSDMVKLFNTYIDELKSLKLAQPIMDDVANNFIMQQYKAAPDNIKEILKKRYPEVVKNKRYISNYKTMMK